MDWLSRMFEMMPVRGRLDLRCNYGAPWRIDQGPGEANEIPYHAVLAGSAVLEDPAGGKPMQLRPGDILLLPGNPRHVMNDGSGARTAPGTQPRVPQFHDQRKSRFARTPRSVVRTLRRRAAARPVAAQLSAAAPGRACRHRCRTEGDCRAARWPRLPDAERVHGRSSGWPGDVERAVDRDVRTCDEARQRDRRRAARHPRARRSSAPCTGGGRSVQRACACMVAARPCAPMQYVARHACPPVSGEARKIGRRSPDRHPDDAGSERTEEVVALHRRGGGRRGISVRSGVPARVQGPHGCNAGAVAQNAGAVGARRLRKARNSRRREDCRSGSG